MQAWDFFCGKIIVLDYCISVTERELINVTSFRCVSEILRLDNVFAILELQGGIEPERVLVQAIIFLVGGEYICQERKCLTNSLK